MIMAPSHRRRNGNSLAVVIYNCCFQRFIADQLPNPSFDAIKATVILHRALYSSKARSARAARRKNVAMQ